MLGSSSRKKWVVVPLPVTHSHLKMTLRHFFLFKDLSNLLRVGLYCMNCRQGGTNVLPALFPQSFKPEKHPPWYMPANETKLPTLHVYNSLTETKVPFTPKEGRRVKWYACGPTVYESAHLGHARAYVTLDILRRIMEDYFYYNVCYQMNITDIDDKIIKCARKKFLMKQYMNDLEKDSERSILEDVYSAINFQEDILARDRTTLLASVPENSTSKQQAEYTEKTKEMEEKNKFLKALKTKIDRLASSESSNSSKKILETCREIIEEWLDARLGREVCDNIIYEEYGRFYEKEFLEDLKLLDVKLPDTLCRVTEHIPQIINFIAQIIKFGFGYITKSSVFFDLKAYIAAGHKYPKLKPVTCSSDLLMSQHELTESEGLFCYSSAEEKRHPNDFALWKFSKAGEPSWNSPWGKGRPGWHIECSTMASELFKENIDIHAGGWDLQFPHHDNELAQSEAYWKKHQWVNYFFHIGHLHIEGLKMGKSLKNFITIRQALNEHSAAEIRMLFLLHPWNQPMNFNDHTVAEAREKICIFRNFFHVYSSLCRKKNVSQILLFASEDQNLHDTIFEVNDAIHRHLCDNFDTTQVIRSMLELISHSHRYIEKKKDSGHQANKNLLCRVARLVVSMLNLFGFSDFFVSNKNTDKMFRDESKATKAQEKLVDIIVEFRDAVRLIGRDSNVSARLYLECDKIRDVLLPPLGIRLDDQPGFPSQWSEQEPSKLMLEIRRRQHLVRSAASEKLQRQIEEKKKVMNKWENILRENPNDIYHNKNYRTWDEQGIPSETAEGHAIKKKTRKELIKRFSRACEMQAQLEKMGGESYVEELQKQFKSLQAKQKDL